MGLILGGELVIKIGNIVIVEKKLKCLFINGYFLFLILYYCFKKK